MIDIGKKNDRYWQKISFPFCLIFKNARFLFIFTQRSQKLLFQSQNIFPAKKFGYQKRRIFMLISKFADDSLKN
jgi:hypothetical protein